MMAVFDFFCPIHFTVLPVCQQDPVQTSWFCYAQLNSRIKFYTTLAWQQFKRPTFLLPASKLPSVQLGVAKSSTYLFLKQAAGQRTFYYRTIGLWNNLDPFLKSSRSVQVFKHILNNKLLDNFVNTFSIFIDYNFRQYCKCFLNLINFNGIVISNFSNLNNCPWKAPLGRHKYLES